MKWIYVRMFSWPENLNPNIYLVFMDKPWYNLNLQNVYLYVMIIMINCKL